mmetsp:Transcript_1851/g.6663  ORF Transcript_1851/g.6663 Transcript_1851/m.6663 type:complete len:221 (+) Transcript_1851:4892-5554(+)
MFARDVRTCNAVRFSSPSLPLFSFVVESAAAFPRISRRSSASFTNGATSAQTSDTSVPLAHARYTAAFAASTSGCISLSFSSSLLSSSSSSLNSCPRCDDAGRCCNQYRWCVNNTAANTTTMPTDSYRRYYTSTDLASASFDSPNRYTRSNCLKSLCTRRNYSRTTPRCTILSPKHPRTLERLQTQTPALGSTTNLPTSTPSVSCGRTLSLSTFASNRPS